MLGHVLHYSVQTGEGTISGDDGNRYSFTNRDWLGQEAPERGARVEFATVNEQAINIYPVAPPGRTQSAGSSQLPAVAAGCGTGCAAWIVLLALLSITLSTSLRLLVAPRLSDNDAFLTIIPMIIAPTAAAIVGYLVYRAVRNRGR